MPDAKVVILKSVTKIVIQGRLGITFIVFENVSEKIATISMNAQLRSVITHCFMYCIINHSFEQKVSPTHGRNFLHPKQCKTNIASSTLYLMVDSASTVDVYKRTLKFT